MENRTSRTVSGSLRIVGEWGDRDDEEDDSITPTPTPTPTSTPNEVFSDSFRLGSDEWRTYDDIPDSEGRHRLHVDVEDGPSATERVRASDWEDNYMIEVYIRTDSIRFAYTHSDPPTQGC